MTQRKSLPVFLDDQDIPITPVIFDYEHEIYGRHGISFDSCTHLDTLGLVLFEPEYKLGMDFPDTDPLRFSYHGRTIEFDKTYDDKKIIPVGAALFTGNGSNLSSRAEDSFFEYVYGVWGDPRISVGTLNGIRHSAECKNLDRVLMVVSGVGLGETTHYMLPMPLLLGMDSGSGAGMTDGVGG